MPPVPMAVPLRRRGRRRTRPAGGHLGGGGEAGATVGASGIGGDAAAPEGEEGMKGPNMARRGVNSLFKNLQIN